jgi:hypothetical protein
MKFVNKHNPLGLPRGSVRAIITLSLLLFSIIWFWVMSSLDTPLIILDTFLIVYYFTKRENSLNNLKNYKLRYSINNKNNEAIISGLSAGDAINKFKIDINKNILIDEIIRID